MKFYLGIIFFLLSNFSIACGDEGPVPRPEIFVDKTDHAGEGLYQIFYPKKFESEEFLAFGIRVEISNTNYIDVSSVNYPAAETDKRFDAKQYQMSYIYISPDLVDKTTISIDYENPPAGHGATLSCGSLAHIYKLKSFVVK